MAVLLDLDGTLVDSVYVHVVAWQRALDEAGYRVAMAKIHAAIGMGSDRLLPWLLGEHPDDAESLADSHRRRFLVEADRLRPTAGARALLDDLDRRRVPYLVSTSAAPDERDALLAALGREDLPVTGADDVSSTKPAPDLLLAACEQLGAAPARTTMVGDAPWDAMAARRAGMASVAVLCGGFADATLRDAGAQRVVSAPIDLVGTL